jgi:hypothetical protein
MKSIIEYKPEQPGQAPEVNVVPTLMKIDKGLAWCVQHIQSLEKALLTTKGNPVTTQDILDMSQQFDRTFIYKLNGVIKDAVINLKSPKCPICQAPLPAYNMSKANPEKGFASTPTFHCENDRMYFNWSRNNKEGWQ